MRAIRSARFVLWLVCVLAYFAATYAADRSPANMANAASMFLSSLTPEQKQVASYAFDNTAERERFGFVPTEMHPRVGLTIEKMTPAQREAAHNLLKSGLSQKGYMTTTAIMELETVLNAIENPPGSNPPKLERNPLKYFVWVFGPPSAKGTWGWKVEGHHVSLNFTIVNGSMVSSAPHFFGSNPAEVMDGPKKGLRVLGYEEDPGRELLMSLSEAQRAKAVFNTTAPNDIVTRNESTVTPLSPSGIVATELQLKQRETLMRIVDAFTSVMAPDIAADRMAALKKAGLDNIGFAWAGEFERGKKHYYRVQGPTFLIEFDNTQGNGNHVHSVWRDFNGDFGRDLLREHLTSVKH
ncbi:MAG: DUF3500 domain-containing protein [Vicinamibacterales bacterium]